MNKRRLVGAALGLTLALGVSSAASGVGETRSVSSGFQQGFSGSREAAPKQRGVAAWALLVTSSVRVRANNIRRSPGIWRP